MLQRTFLIPLLGILAFVEVAKGEDQEKTPIETLIADLASHDGPKRVAATAEIFRRGKDVLPDLKKAGAKQISPVGGPFQTRRLDMIFSLIDGLKEDSCNIFGLLLEKETTKEEVIQMGKKHGFFFHGQLEGVPFWFVIRKAEKSLPEVLQSVLTSEPKVIFVSYREKFQPTLRAAYEKADIVFVGRVLKADLTEGWFPGYFGILGKKVVYEVKETLKGSPGKKITVWCLITPSRFAEPLIESGFYSSTVFFMKDLNGGSVPYLNPKTFQIGAEHLVCCQDDKEGRDFYYSGATIEEGQGRVFLLLLTPASQEGKAIIKATGK